MEFGESKAYSIKLRSEKTQMKSYASVIRQKFFFLRKPAFWFQELPTDWIKSTHILKKNLNNFTGYI